jgi:hypothetical protein
VLTRRLTPGGGGYLLAVFGYLLIAFGLMIPVRGQGGRRRRRPLRQRTLLPYISPSGSAMSSMRAPSGSRK